MRRLIIVTLLSLTLFGCAHTYKTTSTSELARGKYYFKEGYYKRAMRILLPYACDGCPEAEYAVGYMYYYGYGVAQDTDVGHFWIQRAANCGNKAAQKALALMECQQEEHMIRPTCKDALRKDLQSRINEE